MCRRLRQMGGYQSSYAIAVDSNGNVYTANRGTNDVSKITPGGVVSRLSIGGGTNPTRIAVDSNGNVYTANNGTNDVSKITPGGEVSRLSIGGGTLPNGIAVYSSPAAPTNLKVSPDAIVSWTASSGTGVFRYTVTATGMSNTLRQTTSTTSLKFLGLEIPGVYTFTVVATNTGGDSPSSSPYGPASMGYALFDMFSY